MGTDSAAVKDAKVTWKVGGGDQSSRAEQGTLKALDNGQFSKVSKLEVDVSDWFSGKEVECLVYDKTEGKNIVGKKKIKQGDETVFHFAIQFIGNTAVVVVVDIFSSLSWSC